MNAPWQGAWRVWQQMHPLWRSVLAVPLRALVLTGLLLVAQAAADWVSPPPGASRHYRPDGAKDALLSIADTRR
jgi:hypothetical protein